MLHDAERTYAVVAPLRRPPFPGGVVDTYGRVADALIRALAGPGVAPRVVAAWDAGAPRTPVAGPSCFASASTREIVTRRGKLVGSAQLRRRGAFLQHGSILLDADRDRWARAVGHPDAGRGLATLREEPGGAAVDVDALDARLAAGFAAALGVRLERGGLDEEERVAATRLRASKYLSAAWTLRGAVARPDR